MSVTGVWESIRGEIIDNDNVPLEIKATTLFDIIREIMHSIDNFYYDHFGDKYIEYFDAIKIRVYYYDTFHDNLRLKNPKRMLNDLIHTLLNLPNPKNLLKSSVNSLTSLKKI